MPAGRPLDGVTVGLDGRNLGLAQGTGVATYARTLADCLVGLGARPELVAADPRAVHGPRAAKARRWLRALAPRLTARAIAPGDGAPLPPPFTRLLACEDLFRTAWVHFDVFKRLLPLRVATPPRIMHWTYPLPLVMPGAINLYTIHDLIPLTEPALTGIAAPWHRALLAQIVRRADHVVTVSDAARADILRLLDCPPDKVTNTGQASALPPDLLARPADAVAADAVAADAVAADVMRLIGLAPGAYLLCVGNLEPRKNLPRLIEAHAASGTALPLILVGPASAGADAALGPARDRVVRLARDRPAATLPPGAVAWIDHAALADLVALLRGARALLFPSLAEGFGLPILEAMMVGTPVMTSRGGATGEVAGDAALLIDPLDVAAMAEAIRALVTDDALRGRLAAAGLGRAEMFSMTAYRARLADLYGRVLGAS